MTTNRTIIVTTIGLNPFLRKSVVLVSIKDFSEKFNKTFLIETFDTKMVDERVGSVDIEEVLYCGHPKNCRTETFC